MKPLDGIRVCDLSQNLAGPYCTQILADLGADVVKIEPPGGDPARAWGPPFWGGDGTLFLSANRGKRSVILDLKADDGMAALHRLAARSDIFVQALRPGVAERLGFDYDRIRALREDVIYLSLSAFGTEGPLKDLPGYDPLMQAYSGLMSVTGNPDRPPSRVGGSLQDFGTGMWGATAILAALRERDRTGEGARLDIALMDTALIWLSYHLQGYLADGTNPGRLGSGLGMIVPYQAFPTSDGHLMIACGNDAIWGRLCTALTLPELATDPRFATNPSRVAHREELVPVLEARTVALTTRELSDRLTEHHVPFSPIQDIATVARDEQVRVSGMLTPTRHPSIPDYQDVSLPLRWNGERPRATSTPPGAGEHTEEVLRELGLID